VEDPDARAEVTWTVTRPGTGHGFAAGFNRTGPMVSICPTRPTRLTTAGPERIYGTIFFPWPAPVPLVAGDLVTVDLVARLVGG